MALRRGLVFALFAGVLVGGMWYSTRLLKPVAKGVQTMRQGCGPKAPEKFDSFLPRFLAERDFASARTTDPFESLRWDGKEAPEKALLPRAQVRAEAALGSTIRDAGLSTQYERKDGGMELKVFKPDTDWLTYYRFRLHEGCWQLWQVEDFST